MRKIREVLRLKVEAGLSDRQIAAALGAARSTVQECLRCCRAAGVGWPLPAELGEMELQTCTGASRRSRRCHAPADDLRVAG